MKVHVGLHGNDAWSGGPRNPKATLKGALEALEANGGYGVIALGPGTFQLSQPVPTGVVITGCGQQNTKIYVQRGEERDAIFDSVSRMQSDTIFAQKVRAIRVELFALEHDLEHW